MVTIYKSENTEIKDEGNVMSVVELRGLSTLDAGWTIGY